MGYFFLCLSIASGAVKGFLGKKVSNRTSGLKDAIFTNFIRMLFCIPIGFLFVCFDGGAAALLVNKKVLLLAALGGAATSAFLVTWLLAVQKNAFTSVDAFVSMSMLVPILLSGIFYHEKITLSQIIGLALLLSAVVLMSMYSNQIKQKLTLPAVLFLFLVSLSNGLTDFSQKSFVYNADGTPASAFNFYIYVFTAVILFVVFLCLKAEPTKTLSADSASENSDATSQKTALMDKRKLLYIAIMALTLFCNTYFKTLSANYLPAVLIYPLAQGSAILLTTLMSTFFFKEKIKPLCIVGLLVLFAGLLFINVLSF
ncbi:MAG: EamA family transporter [Clostridia bacterium]|nr:EamA family transporter [Clostridia bacterium]